MDRTRLLEQVAAGDPDLAAHITLQIGGAGADSIPTLPIRTNVGLPERFQVSRYLGRGGFGTVCQVYDRERGHEGSPSRSLRDPGTPIRSSASNRNSAGLATLPRPHLIEFYDLFEYHQLWFFTMELVATGKPSCVMSATVTNAIPGVYAAHYGTLRTYLDGSTLANWCTATLSRITC